MQRNSDVVSIKLEERDGKVGTVTGDHDERRKRASEGSDRKFGGPSPNKAHRGGFGRGGAAGNRGLGAGGGFHRDFRTSFQDRNQADGEHKTGGNSHPTPKEGAALPEKRPEKKFTGRCRLFIGNLPNDMTEDEFKKLFVPFGESTEHFLNSGRGFGFVRMDTRHNAENALTVLDCTEKRGRFLRVRFAPHNAALRIKYLSPNFSNEMLEQAFSMFGEVERAVVVVDDRGKPTGEGIVEFSRKASALSALNRITDGVFIITGNPRPIAVELLEQHDEIEGLPDLLFQKTSESTKDRDQGLHFAVPGTFEYEFGQKWKMLYQLHKEQEMLLKRNFNEEVAKLEMDMETAQLEHHAIKMRQDLVRRQEELRVLEEQTQMEIQRRMEMRRQDDERKRQGMEARHRQEEMMRHKQEAAMNPGDMFGIDRHERQSQGRERGGLAPPLQPPPVPPGIERPQRPQMSGPMNPMGVPPGVAPGNLGPMGNPMMGPPNPSGAVNQGQPQPAEMIMQMRGMPPRFEHPHPGMPVPGNNMGPGGNMGPSGKAGPFGGQMREDIFFEQKRQRRF